MSKKNKYNILYLEEGRKQITTNLLFCIGFHINTDGYIVNEETREIFQYNGKYLRSTLLGNPVIHFGDMEFDIFNAKLISSLLDWVLNRSSVEEGIYYRMYHDEKKDTAEGTKSRLLLSSTEGKLETDFYLNESFKYIEMMSRICNQYKLLANDLHAYDLEYYKVRK